MGRLPHAIEFFRDQKLPFWEMSSADKLIGNPDNTNSKYCFAKVDEAYLVYLPSGGSTQLDLRHAKGSFTVSWLNPRIQGDLVQGSVKTVDGGRDVSIGNPPSDQDEDWLAVIRR